jgi:hypothetical protein
MGANLAIQHDIAPFWAVIHDIREEVKHALAPYAEELREAGTMAASELLENAVKYSGGDRGAAIGFKLTADGRRLRIETRNAVHSKDEMNALKAHIDGIDAGDPEKLYVGRLTYLMAHPGARNTGLGLYRIAYEGQFGLRCLMGADNRVAVCATRRITKNHTEDVNGSFRA